MKEKVTLLSLKIFLAFILTGLRDHIFYLNFDNRAAGSRRKFLFNSSTICTSFRGGEGGISNSTLITKDFGAGTLKPIQITNKHFIRAFVN